MNQLILYFWQVCLCKEGPQNSPHSPVFMAVSGFFLLLLLILQWWFADFDYTEDLLNLTLTAISLLISYIAYTYAILQLRKVANRVVQTMSCLFSTHFIIHLFAMPLILIAPYLNQVNLKNPLLLFIGVVYLFLTLGLSIWQLIVTAHIYKHALNSTVPQSVLAAFGLVAVNILTISFWR